MMLSTRSTRLLPYADSKCKYRATQDAEVRVSSWKLRGYFPALTHYGFKCVMSRLATAVAPLQQIHAFPAPATRLYSLPCHITISNVS